MRRYSKPLWTALVVLTAVIYGSIMFSAGSRSGETTIFLDNKAVEACYTDTFWSYITFSTHIECRGSWNGGDCTLQSRENGTNKPWNDTPFPVQPYNTFYEFRCSCDV